MLHVYTLAIVKVSLAHHWGETGFYGDSSTSSRVDIYEFSSALRHAVFYVHIVHSSIHIWLVVYLPLCKNMSSSVGMMPFPIYGKS